MRAAANRKRRRRAFALVAAAGFVLTAFLVTRVHHGRAAAAAPAAGAMQTGSERVRERLAVVLGAAAEASRTPVSDRQLTVDERIAQRANGDPVATVVPALTGMSKRAQLETLKAMQTWPSHKFLWQVPSLANAHDISFEERVELANQLGKDLIEGLEQQGVRYELPTGFTPVSTREPPESPYGSPTR